jgi:hypothetical protein
MTSSIDEFEESWNNLGVPTVVMSESVVPHNQLPSMYRVWMLYHPNVDPGWVGGTLGEPLTYNDAAHLLQLIQKAWPTASYEIRPFPEVTQRRRAWPTAFPEVTQRIR